MTMKRIKIIIPFVLLILMSTSCEDFLNNPPQGYLTSGSFPETRKDAILATNGVYNTMLIWNFHAGGFPILDIMSDEAKKGSNPGDATQINAFEFFTFSSTNSSFNRWWSTLYQGIRRAHVVLENVPGIDMENELKTRLIAETRFLRGFFYFKLVRAFGDVPKVLSTNPPTKLPRSPKSEIYDEIIIPDMEFAIENLPLKSSYPNNEQGRVSKGTAKGLLAKVYLFREDYQNTEKYALEVINSGEFSLDPDFNHVFAEDNPFGTGSLLEVGAVPENNYFEGGNQYANTMGVRGEPNLGWGFGRPSWKLIQDFGDDPRKDATIIFLGETLQGITIQGDDSTPDTTYSDEDPNQIEQIECYNQKTFAAGTEPRYTWGVNRKLLRYSDVLLMAAEALNENNKPQQALQYLNMVRERARAGNPDVLPDITTTDKAELRDIIIEERHRELALEAQRYWDLVRTGKAAEVLGPLGFEEGKHELMPIPQNAIDMSEGMITQNPGYL